VLSSCCTEGGTQLVCPCSAGVAEEQCNQKAAVFDKQPPQPFSTGKRLF